MSESWRRVTWGSVCDLKYGKALSGYRDSTGNTEVFGTNGPVGWTTAEPLGHGPRPIVGRKGAYRGVHLASGDFWVIDTAYWLEPTADLDPTWAYYALLLVDINGMDSGSAIPSLTRDHFRAVPLLLPPLDEQRRIAGVLGALDDLVEVNRTLITDLIATADAIASGYLGRGDERSFGDVCDIFGGGTPSTKDQSFWNGDVRWATPSDITALPSPYLFDTARHITQAGLDACSSKLMPVGSILMTSRATIGAFAVAHVPTAVNQGFIAVEARADVDRWFLFHEMRRRVPEFVQRANGSTFLELSRGVFKGLAVCWPSLTDREELHGKVGPLHAAAAELQVEIQQLAQTRDELLPLLMSGRVRVEDVAA